MTTQEVAEKLVAYCREGQYEKAIKELYSPEIVSVEAEGTPNRTVKGFEALAEKGEKFQNMMERVNSSYVSDPIVAENYFSCSMKMNVRMKGSPVDIDMDEICVYTVRDGKIIKEEFFYTPEPQG